MPIDRRTLIGSAAGVPLAAGAAGAARAAPPPAGRTETVHLWPGDPPGSPPVLPAAELKKATIAGRRDFRLTGIGAPVLFVYRPQKPTGAGLIVMPGGGYKYLSLENEGSNVARVLTPRGWTVFVLSYRLPNEGWIDRADVPLQDAQRAIRLVRERAKAFGVDPARIGVLGFSAGGHVAASLVTDHDEPVYRAIDDIDKRPARPDFAGLAYAVTTMREPATHTASRLNLLGPDASPAQVDRRSPLLRVRAGIAPCFLLHAYDDKTIDPVLTISWAAACRTAGVPVETHLLERGGHGFGVSLAAENPGAEWPDQFHRWAARHGG